MSYGVGSYLQAGQTDKVGAFGSYAIFNPTNLEKLKVAYQDEINLLLKNGINDTELKDAINGYLQSRNVSRSQDRELVGRLSNYLYYDRTLAWDADLEKKISALTVNDINAAVRKWIDPSKITYVEAGDF
ncbi:MAG: insulinase family protein [Bacteroidetes bacterium]|nr:insulinase family protein [Bacteroidota bacterium]